MISILRNNLKNFFFKKKINLPINFIPNNSKINFVDIGSSSFDENISYLDYEFVNLYLFEPDQEVLPSYFNSLKKNLSIYNIGLWSKKAKKNIYILKNQGASSLFKPNINKLKHYAIGIENYEIEKIIKIKLEKLDSYKAKNSNFDFIKIDAEGADYEIILGSIESFKNCLGFQIEIQNIERYLKSKLNYSVLEIMHQNNFEIFINNKELWVKKHKFNIETNIQNVWSDYVFFKNIDTTLSDLKNKSITFRKNYIKKLIFLMLHYKLHDSLLSYLEIYKEEKIIDKKTYNNFKVIIFKNIKSNISIILTDLMKLFFLILLSPLIVFFYNDYKKTFVKVLYKNLKNFIRINKFNNQIVFRNKGI